MKQQIYKSRTQILDYLTTLMNNGNDVIAQQLCSIFFGKSPKYMKDYITGFIQYWARRDYQTSSDTTYLLDRKLKLYKKVLDYISKE